MGFFSTLGSVAKSASDAVQKHNEAVREKAEEYEYKDEDYLKNKFKRYYCRKNGGIKST